MSTATAVKTPENQNTQSAPDQTAIKAKQAENMEGLIFSVKNEIDRHGQFGDKLADMADGFAAAKGTEPQDAKLEIIGAFTQKFGRTPYEHLQGHFDQRRAAQRESIRAKQRGGRHRER